MKNRINIRNMMQEDKKEVLAMMRVFYDSPAVLTTSSDEILEKDFADCVGECPYITGFIIEYSGQTAGYMMTAMCYATEYGGVCIWIEDLYIKPEYRHMGIGSMALEFAEKTFPDAVRFKLEAEEENENAVECYKKNGYSISPYYVMTKEISG